MKKAEPRWTAADLMQRDVKTVDADLPGALKLLQGAVARLGDMALEPAVEPQAGLVVDDGSGLDLWADAHGAQPTGQGKQGPWNRWRSTR